MPYFQNIFGRLGLSPKSKPETSDSSASSSGLSLSQRLDRQRMSPDTRTKAWLNAHSLQKNNRHSRNHSETPSVLGVTGGKVTKHVTTPKQNLKSACKSASKSSTKTVKFSNEPEVKNKRFSLWNTLVGFRYKTEDEVASPSKSEEQFEGSTLVEDDITVISNDALEGDTVVQDQKGDLHKADEHDFSDFTEEEYFLFHKLNARGFEPILNANWHWHFRTFPADLFTTNSTQAYISHTHGPEHHGKTLLNASPSHPTNPYFYRHEVS